MRGGREAIYFLVNHPVPFLFLGTGVVLSVLLRARADDIWSRQDARRLANLALGVASAAMAVFIAIYLCLTNFADHIEPAVICVTLMFMKGQPVYHTATSPDCWACLYGPGLFLYYGLFIKTLGASILSAKIAATMGIVGAILLTASALRRVSRTWWPLGTAVLIFSLLWYGHLPLWVRADSPVMLATAFALFAAVVLGPDSGALAFGVSVGFATLLKIHCPLYFLPLWFAAPWSLRARSVFLALPAAGAVFALPWLAFDNFSFHNFLFWLRVISVHVLVIPVLISDLETALFLAAPALALFVWLKLSDRGAAGQWLKAHRWMLLSWLAAVLIVMAPAAKRGGGPWHLMPFTLSVAYIVVLLARALWDEPRATPSIARSKNRFPAAAATSVLTAFAVWAVVAGSLWQGLNWYRIRQCPGSAVLADLRGVLRQYPDHPLQMGVANGENYQFTWFRPELLFHRQPYVFEVTTALEMELSRLPLAPATIQAINRPSSDIWLIPRGGQPFDFTSYYERPVFSDAFRANFLEHHELRGHSRYFDLWFNREADPTVTEPGRVASLTRSS